MMFMSASTIAWIVGGFVGVRLVTAVAQRVMERRAMRARHEGAVAYHAPRVGSGWFWASLKFAMGFGLRFTPLLLPVLYMYRYEVVAHWMVWQSQWPWLAQVDVSILTRLPNLPDFGQMMRK